ncbi:MAG: DNA mismatch repair protein MutS [Bacteroidia bacterium]|nr:DNA mismatch repair protein MutS [Bacteroidia bacterium]MDW8158033.1 DNA mismatch repair protein MutS [Bacteroidia bacterium]
MKASDKKLPSENKSTTPLMRQYDQIKQKYPGTIVLFRVGDFYETFGQDAIITSQILGIILTKRGNGTAAEVELAGFPYHALDAYLPKLIKAGQRVAICEQLEDPKLAKGIVKRGVTEIVTPGITLSEKILEHKSNNFLAVFHVESSSLYAAAFLDVSTGDFFCVSGPLEKVERILHSLQPAEVVVAKSQLNYFRQVFGQDYYTFRIEDYLFEYYSARECLLKHFQVQSLKGFGLEENKPCTIAAGVMIYYLQQNQQNRLSHITKVSIFFDESYVLLDRFTIRNLELFEATHPDGRSFIEVIDYTLTPMGGRLLKRWITFPLKEIAQIESRLNKVEALIKCLAIHLQLEQTLKSIGDIERLLAKLAMFRITPRECYLLQVALEKMESLFSLIKPLAGFEDWRLQVQDSSAAIHLLATYLMQDPPANLQAKNIIREGVSQELDEARDFYQNANTKLEEYRQSEIELCGIPSLKISYNKVFGYYIEITNAHKNKIPPHFERKQTLTTGERYTTARLKELEALILTAEEKIQQLEVALYQELLEKLNPYIESLQQNANLIAALDVYFALARLALQNNYFRPHLTNEPIINIQKGRHPVIEKVLPADTPFIPNDVYLDTQQQQVLIITGPNMAGKSAVLRQTALITLLAQIGSFVPAEKATIGIVDKIFTRVGASDNLSAGESTFMVEMQETAHILNNATTRSLILLDEIGRGTSTYDGVSIAWALVEYLHQHPKEGPRTMFATHYHELAELAHYLPRVKNYHVSVQEYNGKVVFLRKLLPGSSAHSFGIHVAEMAGMPKSLIQRAYELLQQFENKEIETKQNISGKVASTAVKVAIEDDLSLQIRRKLEKIDIDRITPVEALLKLIELKKILEKRIGKQLSLLTELPKENGDLKIGEDGTV